MTEPAKRVVLVSGASGFLGSALCRELARAGYGVRRLVRRAPQRPDEVQWSLPQGVPSEAVSGVFGVVHLAGESVVGRWTQAKKERIRQSRILGTEALARAIAASPKPPAVWVSASAVGYYGSGPDWFDEASAPGPGFLAQTCVAWESAADAARSVTRVVHPRIGMVLGKDGGALGTMLPVFRAGVGGRVGSGEQFMSWIGLGDTLRALRFALEAPTLRGPVNLVAPQPVTNAEFTRTLGAVLHRPAVVAVPGFALELAYGEFARELVASQRVRPAALLAAGFSFTHPELGDCLRAELAA